MSGEVNTTKTHNHTAPFDLLSCRSNHSTKEINTGVKVTENTREEKTPGTW
jgi:hypothetical protein